MLPDTLRHEDGLFIVQRIVDGDCAALVGISNTGKSSLLRALAREDVRRRLAPQEAGDYVFVYVDFNLMLEATEQGFYELVLRHLIEALDVPGGQAGYIGQAQAAYQTLVAPPTPFQISLSFREGITAVCQGTTHNLVLLFDEFDEPFEQIDGRVFLNLRALKDRYRQRLAFVTATNRRLSSIRRGRDVDEFVEMFQPFTRFLGPLERSDIEEVVDWVAAQEDYTFDEQDRSFLDHQAGGHLGLLLSTCRALGEVTGQSVRDESQDWLIHRQVREQLDRDLNVQSECWKLWEELTEEQQDTLIALLGGEEDVDRQAVELLQARGLLQDEQTLLFSPVFEAFVRRQRLSRRRREVGVRVDVESGSVWVDGQQVEALTDLEYRLLLLLYGRLGKICDKYQIVEAVWGEDYIDQVDDARIDKLLSRLRSKIEPDPRNPRYLITVRGRGYKLSNP
ncbi:MAG TPA: winged helix-turn-helix domain-containing protein [Anaerolineae bacterium]|nr:winged helix-turn-helix domain-containing protein [Anaerolineae bacterium]